VTGAEEFRSHVEQYAEHGRDGFARRVCQELLRADAAAEMARKFITRSATEQDLYAAVFAWWTTRRLDPEDGRCMAPIGNLSGSAPEMCVLPLDHEGRCQP